MIIIYIFARLWPVFSSFQQNLQNILTIIPSYVSLNNMMEELQNHAKKIKSDSTPNCTKIVTASITFEDVCFQYFQYNDDGEFERALILSDAKEFIERLPKGLDTLVGDNGIRLSGGQRQTNTTGVCLYSLRLIV